MGQAATAVGGLFAIKVSTTLLGPAEFGRFSTVLAIAGLGQVCFFGPISQAALRFFSSAREGNDYRTYRGALIGQYLVGLLAIASSWLISVLAGLDWPAPAALIALYTLVSGLQMILLAVVTAARMRKWVAGLQILDALIRPVMILIVVLVASRSASDVIVSYIVTTIVIVSALVLVSTRLPELNDLAGFASGKASVRSSLPGRMLSFTWLFVVFGVLGAVGSHGERLLLANFVSWQDVGTYALMMQLAQAPNLLLTSVINQFYLPVVYQSDSSGTAKLGRSYQYYLLASIAGVFSVAVVVAALGRWIIPLFSSVAFLGHEHLLWFLVLSAGVFNLGQQLVLPGMRENRLSIYVLPKLLHSLGLLGLAFVLVPKWGIGGMAMASMASAVVYTFAVICANSYLARSVSISV